MTIAIHKRVTQRHPNLTEKEIIFAWQTALESALRIDSPRFPECVKIGYGKSGQLIEMVGVQTEDGWLIYHAMTPPSRKTMTEIEKAKRRL